MWDRGHEGLCDFMDIGHGCVMEIFIKRERERVRACVRVCVCVSYCPFYTFTPWLNADDQCRQNVTFLLCKVDGDLGGTSIELAILLFFK